MVTPPERAQRIGARLPNLIKEDDDDEQASDLSTTDERAAAAVPERGQARPEDEGTARTRRVVDPPAGTFASQLMPLARLCGCGRLVSAGVSACPQCKAERYARKRAHTDRRHRPFRLAILERDGWRCHWCGREADTVDYVVALVQGGRAHDSTNAVAACRSCNSRRGAHAGRRDVDFLRTRGSGYPAKSPRVSDESGGMSPENG